MVASTSDRIAREQPEIRIWLDRILNSPVFASSPRQQRFLEYIVTQTIAGHGEQLKGYTIAVDVFDRKADFDPSLDAIVRVEATRLRAKLREYYAGAGSADELVIEFPKGGYSIQIQRRPTALPAMRDAESLSAQAANIDMPSLAVLPFSEIGAETETGYFADGLTDTLIADLSRLSGLLVISRQACFAYRNSTKHEREIASELGVKYLLQGCVQKAGQRVRISVQLVDAATSIPLWSDRYDRELSDIFLLQDDVARCIVSVLQVELAPAEAKRFGHEGTSSIEAHDALLRGLQHHWQYTPKATVEAQRFFERAIEIDPGYAAAHAWLARTLTYRWIMRFSEDGLIALEHALGHAQTAVALDGQLAYAYAVLGWVHYWRKEAEPALAAARKAVAMDPNNFEAYLFLAHILGSAGHGEEGLACIHHALRLNPRSSAWCHWVVGQCHWVLEQYDEALAAWQFSEKLSDIFLPTQIYLCMLYAKFGDHAELARKREKVHRLIADDESIHSPWLNPELQAQHNRLVLAAGLRLPD